jgi:DNA-directed RNA polymerase subunit K/omega
MELKIDSKTKGTLNKFEYTRLLSSRASELENGDAPKISKKEIEKLGIEKGKILSKDYVLIAKEEFYQDKLDLELKK